MRTFISFLALALLAGCSGSDKSPGANETIDPSKGQYDAGALYRKIAANVRNAHLASWDRSGCFDTFREGRDGDNAEKILLCFTGSNLSLNHSSDEAVLGELSATYRRVGYTLEIQPSAEEGTLVDFFPNDTIIINHTGDTDEFSIVDPETIRPLFFDKAWAMATHLK